MKFYSPEDEDVFFGWIDKISCIESCKGIGRELHVIVADRPITFNEYSNLNGLFKRYKLKNPGQLKALFCTEENQDWFESSGTNHTNVYPASDTE